MYPAAHYCFGGGWGVVASNNMDLQSEGSTQSIQVVTTLVLLIQPKKSQFTCIKSCPGSVYGRWDYQVQAKLENKCIVYLPVCQSKLLNMSTYRKKAIHYACMGNIQTQLVIYAPQQCAATKQWMLFVHWGRVWCVLATSTAAITFPGHIQTVCCYRIFHRFP